MSTHIAISTCSRSSSRQRVCCRAAGRGERARLRASAAVRASACPLVPRTARRATAHGLADILADQAGSGAGGRRTEAAQTTGVAVCGKYDVPDSGLRDPEPMSEAKRASLLGSVGLIDGAG